MYYKFFSEDFIRTEVNVRFVKIMRLNIGQPDVSLTIKLTIV